jgi:hypothetical protein
VRIFCARRAGQDRSADRPHSRFRRQPRTRVGRHPDDDVRSADQSKRTSCRRRA